MCEPTQIMMGLSIASSVSSFVGGQQQASSAADAQEDNLNAYYKQTAQKQKEINEAAASDAVERRKQGMIDRAESMVSAGESGALGFTSDRLISDSLMQQGTDITILENNRKNAIKQTNNENTSARANAQSRTNQAYSNAPGLIETGLQIGSDYYSGQQKIKTGTLNKINQTYPDYS